MAQPRKGQSANSNVNRSPGEQRSRTQQVHDLLSDPSLYPDEFKAWLPRWLYNNVNFTITRSQLPSVESPHIVGGSNEIQFQNGWVNFGGTNEVARYWIDPLGNVHLGGIIKSGTMTATAFTLPSGYRPQYNLIIPVVSNNAFGVVVINPDGTVVPNTGSNVYFSLSGIIFRQFA